MGTFLIKNICKYLFGSRSHRHWCLCPDACTAALRYFGILVVYLPALTRRRSVHSSSPKKFSDVSDVHSFSPEKFSGVSTKLVRGLSSRCALPSTFIHAFPLNVEKALE